MIKNKRIFLEFTVFHVISMVISVGAMIYLVVSGLMRSHDGYFLFINSLLLFVVIAAFIISIFAIKQFRPAISEDSNLHDFIKLKMGSLEKSCKQAKYENSLIIFLVISFSLSIQIFFARKTLPEILTTNESFWGLLFGMVVSIPLGIFLSRKIIKHYNAKLKQLKTNLDELENTQA